MQNERLLELMTRCLCGEALPGEMAELEAMLASDEKALARYKKLQQFWNHQDAVSQAGVEESLQRVLKQLQLEPASAPVADAPAAIPVRRWWRRIAVAALMVVTGTLIIWYVARQAGGAAGEHRLVEKQNARGTKSIITLTDGSKIWLNADSKVSYPEIFQGNTREVHLNGEAFFEVTPNPSQPFIIHLDRGTVQVLGTSFNVRAYENEDVVETSVATGKVAFIPKYQKQAKKTDTIFITPNNKLRYSVNEDQASLLPTIARDDKAWTEGKLIFRDATLQEIALELERYFGKKVVFFDEAPRRYRLTGSFQNNGLDEIMYYLSKTKDFSYKITHSELLIAADESQLP